MASESLWDTVNPRTEIEKNELKGTTSLSFPSALDSTISNFFELKFVNYERNATLKKATESPNSVIIFLPLPNDLQDSTNIQYKEYGGFGGLDRILDNTTGSDVLGAMKAQGGAVGSGFIKAAALSSATGLPAALTSGILGSATKAVGAPSEGASAIGDRVGRVVETAIGATVNPALAVQFQGVQLKTYQFTWRLVASSEAESRTINKIIDCIRWNSLPEKIAGDWILSYPNIAFMKAHGNLEYGNPQSPRGIIQFAPSGAVVENLTVTINGSIVSQVFYKGTGEPVEVILSMQLRDRGIVTRDMIDTSWKK